MSHAEQTMDFAEAMERFDPVLGFEVHVELNTATKIFSSAPNAFGDEPNTNVTPLDLGLPGTLPVLNREVVEYAIRLGVALDAQVAETCRFARKNYFYPDTPKNFQTSQYDEPIVFDGHLDVELEDGEVFRVEIERAHLEDDAGKLTHVGGSGRIQGASASLVDYNRAGVPLIEIVTKPIVGAGARAPELARAYVTAIRDIVQAIDISDARMERGNVRCDANVSLMPKGATEFGTAVVGVATSLEASVLITGNLVDLETPQIWAKAISRAHGRILRRIGAQHVVYPEFDAGQRAAHLVSGRMLDYIEMEKGGFTIVKMRPPTELHGFTIGQSKVRSRYGITVFGLMSPGEPFEYATPDTLVSAEDVLVVGGDAALLERFANRA